MNDEKFIEYILSIYEKDCFELKKRIYNRLTKDFKGKLINSISFNDVKIAILDEIAKKGERSL